MRVHTAREFVVAVIVLPLLAAGRVDAADYFVDPVAGNDGNPGSDAAPFRTIAQGASVLVPGDVLTLHGGLYASAETVAFEVSGTASAPITIRAAVGEAPVVRCTTEDPAFLTYAAHLVFEGIVFDGNFQGLEGIVATVHGDGSGRSEFLTVRGCTFRDHLGSGLRLVGADGALVERCILFRNGRTGLDHGIYVECGDNMVVRDCVASHNVGYGIHCYNDLGTEPRSRSGMRGGVGLVVARNVCFGNGFTSQPGPGSGIVVGGEWIDAVVENNICFGNSDAGCFIGYSDLTPTGTIVRNNTFVANLDSQIGFERSSRTLVVNNILDPGATNAYCVRINPIAGPVTFDHNLYGQGGPGRFDLRDTDLDFAGWQASGSDARGFVADSLFVSRGTDDYHLTAASLAIDRGSDAAGAFAPDDFDRAGRPQGSGIDIGADEVGASEGATGDGGTTGSGGAGTGGGDTPASNDESAPAGSEDAAPSRQRGSRGFGCALGGNGDLGLAILGAMGFLLYLHLRRRVAKTFARREGCKLYRTQGTKGGSMRTQVAWGFVVAALLMPLLAGLAGRAEAAEFFVDPVTGNDGNSGSAGAPFRTIAQGAAALGPGDVLTLHGGLYANSETVVFEVSGTASAPITVRAAAGEVPVVRCTTGQSTFLTFAAHIVFEGIHFDGNFQSLEAIDASMRSDGTGRSEFLTVRDCTFRNHLGSGLYLGAADGAVIERCTMTRNGRTIRDHGIYVVCGDNMVIRDCVVSQNAGYGIHCYNDLGREFRSRSGMMGGVGLWVTRNVCFGAVRGSGIVVGGEWLDAVVENNISYGNNESGCFVGWSDLAPTGTIVRNNTFVANLDSQIGFERSSRTLVVNNILDPGATNAYCVRVDPITGTVTFDHNLYGQGGPDRFGLRNTDVDFAGWQASGFDARGFVADPLFVSRGTDDYHLTAASLAIDRGSDAAGAFAPDDFDRGRRPQGSGIDVGADEVGASGGANDGGGATGSGGAGTGGGDLPVSDEESDLTGGSGAASSHHRGSRGFGCALGGNGDLGLAILGAIGFLLYLHLRRRAAEMRF